VSVEGDAGLYIGVGIAAMSLRLEDRDSNFVTGQISETE
jgi:hypothetical protein